MSYVFWRRKKWYNFDTVHFGVGQLSYTCGYIILAMIES